MNINSRFAAALVAALLAAGCSGSSSGDTQTQATQAQEQTSATGALDGVKNRVPIYDSNITAKASTVTPGMYQFETSDTPAQVVAWYKAHIPGSLAGKWNMPDPDAAPQWGYRADVSDGRFDITIQPVNTAYKGYAAGSKSIVAVIDK
jgi:hypothetical protein